MQPQPRFVGQLGPADVISITNAMLGFVAIVLVPFEPRLAARLILLAAIGDALDGVVARRMGGSPVGKYLDSLSDVGAFGVAPAFLVFTVAVDGWGIHPTDGGISPRLVLAVLVPAAFLAMAVVRLSFYTAYDTDDECTEGVQSTLAATVLAAAVVAEITHPTVLVGATAAFAYLMVIRVRYPDLLARDAVLMGIIQGLAVVVPDVLGRAFPYALLTLAFAYLVLAPRFYWGPEPDRS